MTAPAPSNHRIERYQRLIEISRDLASTLDLDDLLSRIVHAAADLSGSQAASILLYDQTRNQLFFQASTNLADAVMRGLSVPVEGSIAGWIVKNREPIIVDDTHRDPRFFSNVGKAVRFSTDSLLGTPLIAKEKVVGVLEAINKIDGDFSDDDQEMLMTLSAQAAVAIENARLFLQSDLISEFVHELRTPLASLNAATHLLLRPEMPQAKKDNMIMIIQSETNRLSDLATAFLDLSRLESGRTQFKVETFEPVMLLGECVGIMRSQMLDREIQFVWAVPEKLSEIKGDRDKIKQVILNLLSNAIKYNRDKGKIILSGMDGNQFVQVSVQDTGPGIPEESLSHLFEKFYRVPGTEKLAQGTGLGLSIARKIVQSHGGEMSVESEVGTGTTFAFTLPIRQTT